MRVKSEKPKALLALTTAALGLPGIDAPAATPVSQAQGNVSFGYYQESDNRMQVEVTHGDFIIPVSDRLEFTFSIDRDTYTGATPAFSIPATMADQPKYKQNDDGTPASAATPADVVSAASGGVTAGGLTILGGLNAFKGFVDAGRAAEGAAAAEIELWKRDNPEPSAPPAPPTIGNVQIDFENMLFAAYYAKANAVPQADGSCAGTGQLGCYYEDGFAIGTVDDGNPSAHLHRYDGDFSTLLGYHADSPGIYLRELNGAPFSLDSMEFYARTRNANPGTGPDDYWEILGFNQASNPGLGEGDGTNYATRVAYQIVANGFEGALTLNEAFRNINALWIHYKGHPKTPPANTRFETQVDNINLSGVTVPIERTEEQKAWDRKLEAEIKRLTRLAVISQYRAVLDGLVPKGTKTVQRFQRQPRESRTMPVFGAKYYFDEATLAFSGGYSLEPDFKSSFGSINLSREFNQKHTTVSAGYSLTSNDITRSIAHSVDSDHSHDNDESPNYPDLREESVFHGFSTSIAQVLDKNTLFQATASYTNQSGYLTNPYKFVYVRGEITPEEYYEISQARPGTIDWKSVTDLEVVGIELFRERRPDERNQWAFSGRLNRHIPALDASLHFDYRYYFDDWGIDSHTFELKWYQPLPFGIMAAPSIRYYSQSQADFFAPYFLAPRADGYYSSDFRLSGFGALSGGITFSKQFTKGIRLEAGFEYYSHAGDLKLGGGGAGDYADFNYFLAHAGLNVNLSAPGSFAGGHHHHGSHHHGSPMPAGIMVGHMMDQADSLMVGYRYMYSNQAGAMLHGTGRVGSRTLTGSACGDSGCISRPTDMTMHMHMLDIMYAPTSWLNLMLMPQLVDMDMSLKQLPGAPEDDEHGGGHSSDGFGDTLMVALIKLFDVSGHRLNLGLGVSAPTGDVDMTVDGGATEDGKLQDYGMQLGSGTWDFKPSLTYTGQSDKWFWGAQVSGTKRLEGRNKSGYALGDVFQTTAWGGYSLTNWLSASVRGVYTVQGSIRGKFNREHSTSAPVDFPSNYGGRYWDVGLGLNLSVPSGDFAGHNLSIEWLQPVSDDVNGYQLERTGSLAVTWNYAF
ncbi:putative uncharacterized protein [Methylocaldum marinum]|uniref:DUF3570 domain-containing protein n=1 Tax=Methylocaldum marinum TaxID=1432792 RepID=A0A286P3W6_9GAMM|nr:DUF3570 domain-containing protein [Methylocaldum marinum]BBA32338.1 putative uncharacterized protein [Methylocaldum marinum]